MVWKALNPYLYGIVVDILRDSLKPRDLKVPDEKLFININENLIYMCERTFIHNWMESWLAYVKWFYTVALNPNPSLAELLDPPVIELDWRGPRQVEEFYRFGIIWKIYDLVGQKGLDWRPPILSSIPTVSSIWISGGNDGSSFLMSLEGLRPLQCNK